MSKAKRTIRSLAARLFGYQIVAATPLGNQFIHYSLTYDDVLEWLACYPHGDTIAVWRKGKLIASRS